LLSCANVTPQKLKSFAAKGRPSRVAENCSRSVTSLPLFISTMIVFVENDTELYPCCSPVTNTVAAPYRPSRDTRVRVGAPSSFSVATG
jgi:hypothetical protein